MKTRELGTVRTACTPLDSQGRYIPLGGKLLSIDLVVNHMINFPRSALRFLQGTGGSADSVAFSEDPRGRFRQAWSLSQVLATIFQGRSDWLDRFWADPPAHSRCAPFVPHFDLANRLLHPMAPPHRDVRVESRIRGAGEA